MVELVPPAGANYVGYTATGVSSQGHVVGIGYDLAIGGTVHALYWDNPVTPATDLNSFLPAGAVNVEANGIDDLGRIIGSATYGGATHSVMWVRN